MFFSSSFLHTFFYSSNLNFFSMTSPVEGDFHPYECSPFKPGEFLLGSKTETPLTASAGSAGYKLNHFMVRIRDPEKSLKFYRDIMGMRTIFTLNAGPFTIYYMGYPQTPEHKADLNKFAVETFDVLQHTLGLLELYHVHGSEKEEVGYYETGNKAPNLGFGHLGFTVPDVPKAVERLRAAGVTVFKDLGVTTRETIPLSQWEADRGNGLGGIDGGYKKTFDQIAFVKDPVSLSLSLRVILS